MRVLETAVMFGLGVDESRTISIVPHCTFSIPSPGIILISGPSGSGKSTILSLIAEQTAHNDQRTINFDDLPSLQNCPLVDCIGSSLNQATSLFSIAGLGDAFVMMRKPNELSDGQRYRLKLAQTIELADGKETPAIILADEFGATLDRLTAQTISRNIRRWVSRSKHCFIAATTHDDLIESLQPNVIIRKGFGDDIQILEAEPDDQREEGPVLTIEPGTLADYKSLRSFHYKGKHPGAVTSVLRLIHNSSTLAGVLVRSLPPLCSQLRDIATRGRYHGLSRHDAASLLNREVRTISRVVIDPRFRGLGLAVKLVRHALDHPEKGVAYTEAFAAMGRVSPFFERAGMTRYDRPPHPEHARLVDAFEYLAIEPVMLASRTQLIERLNVCTPSIKQWFENELRRWHQTAHRLPKSKVKMLSLDDLLIAARDEQLAQPVYYLFRHESAPQ